MRTVLSAGVEADHLKVNRAFPPRLTDSTADRWLKATEQLSLSLNGEKNGKHVAITYWHNVAGNWSRLRLWANLW